MEEQEKQFDDISNKQSKDIFMSKILILHKKSVDQMTRRPQTRSMDSSPRDQATGKTTVKGSIRFFIFIFIFNFFSNFVESTLFCLYGVLVLNFIILSNMPKLCSTVTLSMSCVGVRE
jgi:hypothetical protein